MFARHVCLLLALLACNACVNKKPITPASQSKNSEEDAGGAAAIKSLGLTPAPISDANLKEMRFSLERMAQNAPIGNNLICGTIPQLLARYAAQFNGIPEGQIRGIFLDKIKNDINSCKGPGCAEALGLSESSVTAMLKGIHDTVVSAGEQLPGPAREAIINSFQNLPRWLNPSDFGEALTPRKAYDLTAELAIFKACTACKITGAPSELSNAMASARKDDPFFWAIRPDGLVVIGRGPDSGMSHGVLASINFHDPDNSGSVMGNVFVGGEGWIDPHAGVLYLDNKSGHYRPEFSRLNNPSIKRLFTALLPPKVTRLELVDKTKPR